MMSGCGAASARPWNGGRSCHDHKRKGRSASSGGRRRFDPGLVSLAQAAIVGGRGCQHRLFWRCRNQGLRPCRLFHRKTRLWKARQSFRIVGWGRPGTSPARKIAIYSQREPVKYAPQYGGHCADGVSFGTITTNIDPKAWRIIEGKLYLSYDPGAADGFEKKPVQGRQLAKILAGGRTRLWFRKSCRRAGSRPPIDRPSRIFCS